MKKREQLDEIVEEIKSLPEPNFDRVFDMEKQRSIHDNLMHFASKYNARKKSGIVVKRLSTGALGVVALFVFMLLLLPNDHLFLNSSNHAHQGQEKGNVEEIDWQIDNTFVHDNHTYYGTAGEIGLTNLSNNDNTFTANVEELFMWRLFGEPKYFEKELLVLQDPNKNYGDRFKIIANHKETNTKINLLEDKESILVVPFYSPNEINGWNRGIQIQESMLIPKKGTWNIQVYINHEFFGSVNIKVK